jgi:hypothetical protein
MSAILGARQITAVQRIGDIMIPGGDGLPCYSETGCVAHVDPILEVTPAEDVVGLKILLALLSLFPEGLLVWFLRFVGKVRGGTGPLAGALRNIDIGLKGLVMSSYYSNRTGPDYRGPLVYEALDFDLRVVKPESDRA